MTSLFSSCIFCPPSPSRRYTLYFQHVCGPRKPHLSRSHRQQRHNNNTTPGRRQRLPQPILLCFETPLFSISQVLLLQHTTVLLLLLYLLPNPGLAALFSPPVHFCRRADFSRDRIFQRQVHGQRCRIACLLGDTHQPSARVPWCSGVPCLEWYERGSHLLCRSIVGARILRPGPRFVSQRSVQRQQHHLEHSQCAVDKTRTNGFGLRRGLGVFDGDQECGRPKNFKRAWFLFWWHSILDFCLAPPYRRDRVVLRYLR